MKRWVSSVLMIIMLIVNIIPMDVYASKVEEKSEYVTEDFYDISYEHYMYFMEGYTWNHHFLVAEDLAYIHMGEQIQENELFKSTMTLASNILKDVSLIDVANEDFSADDAVIEYYQMALASLLVTMEENLEDAIKYQTEADLSMEGLDYVLEGMSAITEVGSSLLGADAGILDKVESQWAQACNIFSTDAEYMNSLIGNVIDSIDSTDELMGKLYEAEKYVMFNELLVTIQKNSDNLLLRKAALNLKKALEYGYQYKLEQIVDGKKDVVGDLSTPFFQIMDLLEHEFEESIENGTAVSDGTQELIDNGVFAAIKFFNGANALYGAVNAGTEAGVFIADAWVGGSNIFLRYHEMMAMSEVREALLKEIQDNNKNIRKSDDFEIIQENINLLEKIIYVDIRGEYCLYSLLTDDSNTLGIEINNFIKGNDLRTFEEWYKKVVQINSDIFELIDSVIPEAKDFLIEAKNNNDLILQEGTYRYSAGDFLAELFVTTEEDKKLCYWGEWDNYGESASIEDFEFIWVDGIYSYEVIGWRSNQLLEVNIELREQSIILSIVNTEGTMYSDQGSSSNEFKAEYVFVSEEDNYTENEKNEEQIYETNISAFNLLGNWYSTDGKYVFHFGNYSNPGDFADAYFVNFEHGKNISCNVEIIGSDSLIVTPFGNSNISYTFYVENGCLITDDFVLNKVPDEYIYQILGSWSNSEYEYKFANDGQYNVSGNTNSHGMYYIISASQIAICEKGREFRILNYTIKENELILNDDLILNKEGVYNSTSENPSDLANIICGIWVEENTSMEEYRFYNNGLYERYYVAYQGEKLIYSDLAESGYYELIDANTVRIYYNDIMSADLEYDEHTETLKYGWNFVKKN